MPNYEYGTPRDGVPFEAIPVDEDTALIATDPAHRVPDDYELFSEPIEIIEIDTDKIEAFPEAAHMVAMAETSAKWEVIGLCHDAMTAAGIPLAKASEIMATVVAQSGLIPTEGPSGRGPNGTLRHTPGDAPHRPAQPDTGRITQGFPRMR
jgi:hypothetical protein